jgi:hypothetical protein
MHELFNVIFENVEKGVWLYLEAPLLQSSLKPKKLLKVVRDVMVVVYAVEAELNIRLNLLIALNKCLHA